MIFNSPVFLFVFLPVTLILSYLVGKKWRNSVLLLASLIFYAWGGVSYSLIILGSIFVNFLTGRLVGRKKGWFAGKNALVIGLIVNILVLAIFKYAQFIIGAVFDLLHSFSIHAGPAPDLKIRLPIGISFFTFQAISYLVDVYRKEVPVQKNPFHLGLYISLFPQLIAGPIVRYNQIADQIQTRTQSIEKFAAGIRRFVQGLARKVLIANNIGMIADGAFETHPAEMSWEIAWIGIIAYALQIYHDFAGYSDMAIGLGKMLGFEFPENFNFPYIARSVREFWRRWHITLSTWFRDYLYIPLGGNRLSSSRTMLNLLIVFFLTGLWHGASWNFVIWGLFHGFFMILERLVGVSKNKWVLPFSHLYLLLVVLHSWVFFRADTLPQAWQYLRIMWGLGDGNFFWINLFSSPAEQWFLFIAVVFASPLPELLWKNWMLPFFQKHFWLKSLQTITVWGVMLLCLMYIAGGTYNPFIYFRF